VKRPQGFDPKNNSVRKSKNSEARVTPLATPLSATPEREGAESLLRDSSSSSSHVNGDNVRQPLESDFTDSQSLATEGAHAVPDEIGMETPQLPPSRAKQALRDLKRAQRERRVSERRERRRFIKPNRIRRRRIVIAFSSVLVLAAFVAVGVLSPLLNLRTITVLGAERLDPEVVSASLEEQLGTPLALIDADEVRAALSTFNLIEEYAIQTLPPHELIVRIVERKPVITLKRGEVFDLVDAAGVVIETSEQRLPGYPLGEALVADVNSPAFLAAAKSMAYMNEDLAAQVNIATATTDQDVTFVLESGLTIVWGSAQDSVRKSILVNTMLASLEGQRISTLNVSSVQSPVFS